jgi:hypothetical protein
VINGKPLGISRDIPISFTQNNNGGSYWWSIEVGLADLRFIDKEIRRSELFKKDNIQIIHGHDGAYLHNNQINSEFNNDKSSSTTINKFQDLNNKLYTGVNIRYKEPSLPNNKIIFNKDIKLNNNLNINVNIETNPHFKGDTSKNPNQVVDKTAHNKNRVERFTTKKLIELFDGLFKQVNGSDLAHEQESTLREYKSAYNISHDNTDEAKKQLASDLIEVIANRIQTSMTKSVHGIGNNLTGKDILTVITEKCYAYTSKFTFDNNVTLNLHNMVAWLTSMNIDMSKHNAFVTSSLMINERNNLLSQQTQYEKVTQHNLSYIPSNVKSFKKEDNKSNNMDNF